MWTIRYRGRLEVRDPRGRRRRAAGEDATTEDLEVRVDPNVDHYAGCSANDACETGDPSADPPVGPFDPMCGCADPTFITVENGPGQASNITIDVPTTSHVTEAGRWYDVRLENTGDFSSSAETATDYAIELAAKFQAELTLLHVYTLQIYIGPLGESYPLSPETVHKIQDDSERALDKIRQRASSAGVRARTINTDGIASNVIVATAQEAKADLIVIGTHGRTGIKHFLLGSVAEQVLRRACCPVLTVREDAGKER